MKLIRAYNKISYRDLPVRTGGSLLISYLIDAQGRPETFFQRLTTPYFYVDLVGGFLMTFLVWESIRAVAVFLDQRLDWFRQTALRCLLQGVLGVFLPSLLAFFLTYLYMESVWNQRLFESSWLDNEFFAVVILIVFINFYYFTFWLYQRHKEYGTPPPALPSGENPLASEPPVPAPKSGPVQVTRGEKILLLPQEDIASALLKEGYCYLKTFSGESFVTTYALDDLEESLDGKTFFRVNRQVLLHRGAIRSFSSIENGKVSLDAAPYVGAGCIVSQKKARPFRAWIAGEEGSGS